MMKHEAHALCSQHINRFVRIQMHDGAIYDGVIEKVDDEHVYIASPELGENEERFLPYPGYGPIVGPGFGYGPGWYPYPRFRRYGLPLAGLLALSLLPWGGYWY